MSRRPNLLIAAEQCRINSACIQLSSVDISCHQALFRSIQSIVRSIQKTFSRQSEIRQFHRKTCKIAVFRLKTRIQEHRNSRTQVKASDGRQWSIRSHQKAPEVIRSLHTILRSAAEIVRSVSVVASGRQCFSTDSCVSHFPQNI
jgi:hypothetical protein